MTIHNTGDTPRAPAIRTPEMQQAVWFLGALMRIRLGGDATAGDLAIIDVECDRGYGSPTHRHLSSEETFLVLNGELRVQVAAQTHVAGPGAIAFLPRQLSHGFVVLSTHAHYLSVHTPAGFEQFAQAVGTPAAAEDTTAPEAVPPDPAELAALASTYGIEIVGPPPAL